MARPDVSITLAQITTPLDWIFLIAGLAFVFAAASSVMRTLVITRGSRSLVTKLVGGATRTSFRAVARRFKNYYVRDRINTWLAPMDLMFFLFAWLILFLFGFAFILRSDDHNDLVGALREAGSSLFTLGFATSNQTQLTLVDFIAAATGPIVIGLLIGYLPAHYAAYNRREVDVAVLHARAGEPNWGPEILARHAMIDAGETLNVLWTQWERWSADVSESHTTYQMLIHTRSARPNRNWLVALLSVMDAAALQLTLNPQMPQGNTRTMLRQGIECMHDLTNAIQRARFQGFEGHPTFKTPDRITLSFEEFSSAVDFLDESGYEHSRTAAEAWPHFEKWRVNYESLAYSITAHIDAVPALWSGPRHPPTPQIPPVRPRYVLGGDSDPDMTF